MLFVFCVSYAESVIKRMCLGTFSRLARSLCDNLHLRASAHLWHVSAFLCTREFFGISWYIKSPILNENRAKITLLTTYCCILTYEFPLTAESPGTLTFQKQYRFQGSASSSGVIFLSRKSTGLPSSPARFGFLLVNLLSPSWLFLWIV